MQRIAIAFSKVFPLLNINNVNCLSYIFIWGGMGNEVPTSIVWPSHVSRDFHNRVVQSVQKSYFWRVHRVQKSANESPLFKLLNRFVQSLKPYLAWSSHTRLVKDTATLISQRPVLCVTAEKTQLCWMFCTTLVISYWFFLFEKTFHFCTLAFVTFSLCWKFCLP